MSSWKWQGKKVWGLVAAGAVLVGGGPIGFFWMQHAFAAKAHDAEAKHGSVSGNAVRLSTENGSELVVRAFEIQESGVARREQLAFTGSLQPRFQANVGFRLGGKIVERLVEVGDQVRQGDLLFRLDPEDTELQLRVAESELVSAKASLRQAEAEELRMRELLAGKSVSQSEYDLGLAGRDTSRARLDAAERRLTLARNQRDYCDLKADNDGLVTAVTAEVGQVVNMGQPVLQWMQGTELEAAVSIPETLVNQVKSYQAEVSFWSRPHEKIKAELREISPIADPVSRTYDARFKLLDRPSDLALGMTSTVHLIADKFEGVEVPLSSIAQVEGISSLWRIRSDGSVENVAIEVLKFESDVAFVRGDLRGGDKIVSAGVQRIDADCKVRIWYDKL